MEARKGESMRSESVFGTASGQKKRIGELLVADGLITAAQLKEALCEQARNGKRIVETLIALEYLDSDTFFDFLLRSRRMAPINIEMYTIPSEVIALVPRAFAFQHQCIPVDRIQNDLTVAMACPLDHATIQELEQVTGLRVRTLLISLDALQHSLINYYGEEAPVACEGSASVEGGADSNASISLGTIIYLVQRLETLPALPESVQQLRVAMDDPDTTIAEVAAIVEQDPGLSAQVLKLANSAAFALPRRVETVLMAAKLLGIRNVYDVVLSSAIINYFDKTKAFDYKAFWNHSFFCATTARELAKRFDVTYQQTAFSAGLLHDIGRLVFAEIVPEIYTPLDSGNPGHGGVGFELQQFGIAHPELGYVLATNWDLPEIICDAIRYHHDFSLAQRDETFLAIISLAGALTDAYVVNNQALPEEASPGYAEALALLELRTVDLLEIVHKALGAMQEEETLDS